MLITEIEFKAALPISANFTFAKLVPDIKIVEKKFIKPILGVDLYDQLQDNLESLTPEETALIIETHNAIANLALNQYLPKANVFIGDNGLQAIHTAEAKPAFEWQTVELQKSLLRNGYNALDNLIEYIQSVANSDFPEWLTSPGNTFTRGHMVNSASQFTDYVPKLENSHYLYFRMIPIIDRHEKGMVEELIGKAQREEIQTQIIASSTTAANTALLEFLEPALAHLTWAYALQELNLQIDEDGINMLITEQSRTLKATIPAPDQQVKKLIDYHISLSEKYQTDLKTYLLNNLATYPLISAADIYDTDFSINYQFPYTDTDGVVPFF